jgi:hypothetical protein
MLFDLFVPFGMLWKPTRIPMFLAAIFFHSHNYYVFPIGVFPPLSLTLTLLYFDPDFPRKLLPSGIKQKCRNSYFSSLKSSDSMLDHLPRKILLGTLGIFVFVQLILPFRHFLNPGWTLWHEEGHYFAWTMMLRQKVIEIRYDLTHPVTKEIRYAPLEDYLNSSQIRTFAGNTGMVLLFAHHLKDLVKKKCRVHTYRNSRDPNFIEWQTQNESGRSLTQTQECLTSLGDPLACHGMQLWVRTLVIT